MQNTLSRIWTRVSGFISYDDNHYNKHLLWQWKGMLYSRELQNWSLTSEGSLVLYLEHPFSDGAAFVAICADKL